MSRGPHSLHLGSVFALAWFAFPIPFAIGAGCAGPSADVAPAEPGRESAEVLGFEQAVQGELDCGAGVCRRWYRIEQSATGELQVDVHAQPGSGVVDFDVRLEGEHGEILWGFAPTGDNPRRVRRVLGPGTYFLLLTSCGGDDECGGDIRGPLVFEILARVEAPEWLLLAPGATPGAPRISPDGQLPARAPSRPEFWVHAEIERVEGNAGVPTFVVIDAGSREDLRVGLLGELLEQSATIAVIELIQVDERSSRARLLRPPSAAISFATRARIRVPLAAR